MNNTTVSFYNENSAKNALLLEVNGVSFYYSYKTIVAVHVKGASFPYVIKNYWGPTTGKHLNWIDNGNKDSRFCEEDFKKLVVVAMEDAGIKELPTINIV